MHNGDIVQLETIPVVEPAGKAPYRVCSSEAQMIYLIMLIRRQTSHFIFKKRVSSEKK